MPIRVALAVVALAAGIASTHAAARLESGQIGYLSSTALACPTHESMASILKLANTNFDAAVAKGAADGCLALDKGQPVFVVEVPNKTFVCLVPKGKSKSCLWTAADRVVATD